MERRTAGLFLLVAAPLILGGCKPREQVTHYRVERIESPAASTGSGSTAAKTDGMLAAIVPHDTQGWFFKLTGPVEAVVEQAEPFRKFIESITFVDGQPRYTAPEGWRAKGRSDMRYETFEIPTAGMPLELAISSLPKPAQESPDYYLANINRWRGQMSLEPIDAAQLATKSMQLKLADGTATAISLVGKLAKGGMSAPLAGSAPKPVNTAQPNDPSQPDDPARPGQDHAKASDSMLAAMVPHGDRAWFFKLAGPSEAVDRQSGAFEKFVQSVQFKGDTVHYQPEPNWKAAGPSDMRYETFRIPSGDKPLELTVTALGKPPGDDTSYLLANINRWRGQLGLSPLEADQLAEESKSLPTAEGTTATLVHLHGKLRAGGMAAPFARGNRDGK